MSELGAGTGRASRYIASKIGGEGKLIASDFNAGIPKRAKGKMDAA